MSLFSSVKNTLTRTRRKTTTSEHGQILDRFTHESFPDIFLDSTISLPTMRLTKAHEGVHRQLAYASCYGMFTTFLVTLHDEDAPHFPPSLQVEHALTALMKAQFFVQEGCATISTFAMHSLAYGSAEAQKFVASLPEPYRIASAAFQEWVKPETMSDDLRSIAIRCQDKLYKVIALACLNGRICEEFHDIENFTLERLMRYLEVDAPNRRLATILNFLSEERVATRLSCSAKRRLLRQLGPRLTCLTLNS